MIDKHKSEVNVSNPKLAPGQGVTNNPNTLGKLCNDPKKLSLLYHMIGKLVSFSALLRTKSSTR